MEPRLQPLVATLKRAREQKGLTQRELAKKVGLPQSHISRIERGAVDLQTTGLIEIARALDMELVLVPRALLSAVQALQRGIAAGTGQSARVTPAYQLPGEEEDTDE
jgi:transcriptional regulator with XRE-family HTH domain